MACLLVLFSGFAVVLVWRWLEQSTNNGVCVRGVCMCVDACVRAVAVVVMMGVHSCVCVLL